jgi:predicted nucleic acid-binding protein
MLTARLAKVVFDTNVLVSAVLSRHSSPAMAVMTSLLRDVILTSRVYREECYEVFQRPKFDRYASLPARLTFLDRVFLSATPVAIRETFQIAGIQRTT